eukprot:TRINITY_DN4560_c0_g2_i1.p1 TRINITY_DN4560_c0_g2~~TRINITY_DN4560_c0_g2_i1.p1  ORF type:complete len:274 (+),score=37.30 TRINITY_DN4560_c0_g2_i1:170-991(+)
MDWTAEQEAAGPWPVGETGAKDMNSMFQEDPESFKECFEAMMAGTRWVPQMLLEKPHKRRKCLWLMRVADILQGPAGEEPFSKYVPLPTPYKHIEDIAPKLTARDGEQPAPSRVLLKYVDDTWPQIEAAVLRARSYKCFFCVNAKATQVKMSELPSKVGHCLYTINPKPVCDNVQCHQHFHSINLDMRRDCIDKTFKSEMKRASAVRLKCTAPGCSVYRGDEGVKLKQCGRCQAAYYCSAACQRGDWRSHKIVCAEPIFGVTHDSETCGKGGV